MCHYHRNIHNVAFCIFQCRNLNNFYKLIVIIATCNEKLKHWPYKQYHVKTKNGIFTKNYTIFFSNEGKTENGNNFRFDKFYVFLRWYKYNIYIVTTSSLDFIQLYIIYKVYLIKRIFLSKRNSIFGEES